MEQLIFVRQKVLSKFEYWQKAADFFYFASHFPYTTGLSNHFYRMLRRN
ncbi:Beta-13-glucosyltransferase [Lactococcus lactis subsp. lactis]|nr:Beta-13-glucosyltransferase [Lactococcus lactis subsp. lactis]